MLDSTTVLSSELELVRTSLELENSLAVIGEFKVVESTGSSLEVGSSGP